MRILLSAFACAPGVGSEAGTGWKYALALSDQHEVWVITDASRRELIEADPAHAKPGLHFVYYRPRLLQNTTLDSRSALFVYECWQSGAWRVARKLDHEHDLDLTWHLTYGSFRHPSHYWRLGKPFVFGPLGGGETSARRLRRGLSLRAQGKEWFRDVVNKLVLLRPRLRSTYRNASLVIARTPDTRAALPKAARAACVLQQNIGAYALPQATARIREPGAPLRALFAGRLLWLKGVDLGIKAIAACREQGGSCTLNIIGDGPEKLSLQTLVADLGLSDHVTLLPHLPQQQLFSAYQDYDVFLFPSMHDSGGNVVLEALSHGLPVVCLDLGGPPCFVDHTCGVVVPARDAGASEVVHALAAALLRLEREPATLAAMSRQALTRAESLTWEKQIQRCLDLIAANALSSDT